MHAFHFWGQERGLPIERECPTCDWKRKYARVGLRWPSGLINQAVITKSFIMLSSNIYRPLSCPQKWTACIVTSLDSHFARRLSNKKHKFTTQRTICDMIWCSDRATPQKLIVFKHVILLYKVYNRGERNTKWLALIENQIITSYQGNFKFLGENTNSQSWHKQTEYHIIIAY